MRSGWVCDYIHAVRLTCGMVRLTCGMVRLSYGLLLSLRVSVLSSLRFGAYLSAE